MLATLSKKNFFFQTSAEKINVEALAISISPHKESSYIGVQILVELSK